MNLIDLFCQNQQISDWKKNLHKNSRQLIMGLSASTKAITIAAGLEESEKILVLTSSQNEADRLASDLISLLGEDRVYTFLADDTPIAEFVFASQEKIFSRLDALNFLIDHQNSGILVTNVAASKLLLPDSIDFKNTNINLTVGQEYDLNNLVKMLSRSGYKKVSQVLSQGEYSLRGDILDIFERSAEAPYRLEFFGDEIDVIRIFNPENQTSIDNIESILIKPASDILLSEKDYARGRENLEAILEKAVDPALKSYLEELLISAKEGFHHADIRKFLSYFYQKEWTILDYLPVHSPVFFDDFQKIVDRHAQFELETASLLTDDLQNCKALSSQKYFADKYQDYRQYKPATFFSSLQKGLGNLKFDALYQFNQYPMQEFFSQFPLLKEEINRYKKSGYTIILQANSSAGLQSLHKNLQEYDIHLDYIKEAEIHKNAVQLIEGNLVKIIIALSFI